MDRIWLKQYPSDVPTDIDPDLCPSVTALFEQSVRKYADRPAFTGTGETLSFSKLDRFSRDFAAYLQNNLGIEKGDCVAIMLPNRLEFPVALFGAMRTGARITNINPLYTPSEMAHQLKDSGARVIVIDVHAMSVLEKIVEKSAIQTVIVVGADDPAAHAEAAKENKQHSTRALAFDAALAIGRDSPLSPIEVENSEILFLQYTGGTTGISKGAALTHRNVIANILQCSAALGPIIDDGREIVITALPLYHIFALTINCLAFVHHGGHNILITNPRDMRGFVAELGKWKFSVITGVNTLFGSLLSEPDFRGLDFSALKICIGGGAAIQQAVADRWVEVTGCHVLEGYGLSETSPLLTMNPYDCNRYTGSIGLPIPSTE
ncbi:MAG: AMP-binding protein, partial [Pseudomonadota bacterium]